MGTQQRAAADHARSRDADGLTHARSRHLHRRRTRPPAGGRNRSARTRPAPVPPTRRARRRCRGTRRTDQFAARSVVARTRSVGVGRRPGRPERWRADRHRHVRRQRRAQHRRADQRSAVLRPAPQLGDPPREHAADRRRDRAQPRTHRVQAVLGRGPARDRRRNRLSRSRPQPLQLDGQMDGWQPHRDPHVGMDRPVARPIHRGRQGPLRRREHRPVGAVAPDRPGAARHRSGGRPSFVRRIERGERSQDLRGDATDGQRRSVDLAGQDRPSDDRSTRPRRDPRTADSGRERHVRRPARRRDGGDGPSGQREPRAPGAQRRLGRLRQPRRPAEPTFRSHARTQCRHHSILPGAVTSLVESGHDHDVLRVRSNQLEQRRGRYRPWHRSTSLRARRQRAWRPLWPASVARRAGPMGSDAVPRRLPRLLRQPHRRLARWGSVGCTRRPDHPEPGAHRQVARRRAATATGRRNRCRWRGRAPFGRWRHRPR